MSTPTQGTFQNGSVAGPSVLQGALAGLFKHVTALSPDFAVFLSQPSSQVADG